MVISAFITEVYIGIKDQQLERVLSIKYLIKFKKSHTKIKALIDSIGEINTMTLAYATIQKLRNWLTNIEA